MSSANHASKGLTGPLLGIVCIAAAVFLLSASDAIIKGLREELPTLEIIAIRSVFGLVPVLVILQMQHAWSSLKTRRPVAQIVRGGLIVVSYALFLEALAVMPLATAVALTFSAPIFVAALSPVVLGERVSFNRWVGVVVGFIGVLVIVQPHPDTFHPDALFPLGAALAYASASLLARRLGATDPPAATAFFTGIMFFLGAAPFVAAVPSAWVTPTTDHLLLLALCGFVAGTAHFLIIAAYRHAQASMVAPFEYTALVWAALFGLVFYDELPDLVTFGGIALIIGGGLWIIYGERSRSTA